jgi:hypothetical protein
MNIGSSPEYGEQPLPIHMAEGNLVTPRRYRRLPQRHSPGVCWGPTGGLGDGLSRTCWRACLPQSKYCRRCRPCGRDDCCHIQQSSIGTSLEETRCSLGTSLTRRSAPELERVQRRDVPMQMELNAGLVCCFQIRAHAKDMKDDLRSRKFAFADLPMICSS